MKYDKIKNYIDEEFRRLSGIKRTTFKKIIEILAEAEKKNKIRGGETQIRFQWKKCY